jgi:hypothetical protein
MMFFLGLEVEVGKREVVGGRKEVGLVLYCLRTQQALHR